MTYDELIGQISRQEKAHKLNKSLILGVPLWRIIRSGILENYACQQYGFQKRDTRSKQPDPRKLVCNFFQSLFSLSVLLIKRKKKSSLIFSFPRLQKTGTYYTDKFTEPLIHNSVQLQDSYIFQRALAGQHQKPRHPDLPTIYTTDCIDYTSKILALFTFPLLYIFSGRKIISTYLQAKKIYVLSPKKLIGIGIKLSEFSIAYWLYTLIFSILNPSRILLVNKELHYAAITAAKQRNIHVYEIQHGITHGHTILYSGEYHPQIDPDYFLVFGAYWQRSPFGLPAERIINIGWAYGTSIQKEQNKQSLMNKNTVLVISEPTKTDQICAAIRQFSKQSPETLFHIRLHPQENLSENWSALLREQDNVKMVSNQEESSISLIPYQKVMGVNSSVLYEALSLFKPVAKISMCNCSPYIINEAEMDPFLYIRTVNDFKRFMQQTAATYQAPVFYAPFDKHVFNKLLSGELHTI